MKGGFLLVIVFAFFAIVSAQTDPGFTDVVLIDNFDVDTLPIVVVIPENPSFPFSEEKVEFGGDIIGQERNLDILVTSGQANDVLSTSVTDSSFISSTQQEVTAVSRIQYDGSDGTSTLNPRGLLDAGANTDFTSGNAFAIRARIESDLPTQVFFKFYSGSEFDYCLLILQVPGDDIARDYILNYNTFDLVGEGCSFERIGAVEVEVAMFQNVDVVIESLSTWGPVPPTPTPTRTKSPSLSPPPPPPEPSGCICRCPRFTCNIIRHDDGDFYNNFFTSFFNIGFFNFGNFFAGFFSSYFYGYFFFFQNYYFFDIWYWIIY